MMFSAPEVGLYWFSIDIWESAYEMGSVRWKKLWHFPPHVLGPEFAGLVAGWKKSLHIQGGPDRSDRPDWAVLTVLTVLTGLTGPF